MTKIRRIAQLVQDLRTLGILNDKDEVKVLTLLPPGISVIVEIKYSKETFVTYYPQLVESLFYKEFADCICNGQKSNVLSYRINL